MAELSNQQTLFMRNFDGIKTGHPDMDDDDIFSLFIFDTILRNYDLSEEQVDLCWTDGSGDGGIDGFFTFINNNNLEPDTDLATIKKNPTIDLYIFQCKFEKNFSENVLNKLNATIQLILDNSKSLDDMRRSYSQDLIESAKLFRDVYFNRLPTLFPKLNVHYIYATYGKEARVDNLFPDRRAALEATTCGSDAKLRMPIF